MSDSAIEMSMLTKAVLALLDEAYQGPPDPAGTWFTDNEPDCGVLGTAAKRSAAEASRPLGPGDPLSLASHLGHLRFALELANRAMRGENAYAEARWARSWDLREVGEAEWKALREGLRDEYKAFRAAVATGAAWEDETHATGVLGLLAHGAWHLGAIRQGLGRIKAPEA